MDNLATFSLSIEVDKESSYESAVETLRYIQKQVDKDTITYKLTGDKKQLDSVLREIQNKNLEIGTSIKLEFDQKKYNDFIENIAKYKNSSKSGKAIGKEIMNGIQTGMEDEGLTNMLDNILNTSGSVKSVENVDSAINELLNDIKRFNINNVTDFSQIEDILIKIKTVNQLKEKSVKFDITPTIDTGIVDFSLKQIGNALKNETFSDRLSENMKLNFKDMIDDLQKTIGDLLTGNVLGDKLETVSKKILDTSEKIGEMTAKIDDMKSRMNNTDSLKDSVINAYYEYLDSLDDDSLDDKAAAQKLLNIANAYKEFDANLKGLSDDTEEIKEIQYAIEDVQKIYNINPQNVKFVSTSEVEKEEKELNSLILLLSELEKEQAQITSAIGNDMIKGLSSELDSTRGEITELNTKLRDAYEIISNLREILNKTDKTSEKQISEYKGNISELNNLVISLRDKIDNGANLEDRVPVDKYNELNSILEETKNKLSMIETMYYNSNDMLFMYQDWYHDDENVIASMGDEINRLKGIISSVKSQNPVDISEVGNVVLLEQKLEELESIYNRIIIRKNELNSSKLSISDDVFANGLLDVLQSLLQELNSIRVSLGSVDEDNGFNNLIVSLTAVSSLLDGVVSKLDEIGSKVGKTSINITANDDADAIATQANLDTYWNSQLTKYRSKYEKIYSSVGGLDSLYTILSNNGGRSSISEYESLYNDTAIKELGSAEEQIRRIMEFIDEVRSVVSDYQKAITNLEKKLAEAETKEDKDFYKSELSRLKNDKQMKKLSSAAKGGASTNFKTINKNVLEKSGAKDKNEDAKSAVNDILGNEKQLSVIKEISNGLISVIDELKIISDILNNMLSNNSFSDFFEKNKDSLNDFISRFEELIKLIGNNDISMSEINSTASKNGVSSSTETAQIEHQAEALEHEAKAQREVNEAKSEEPNKTNISTDDSYKGQLEAEANARNKVCESMNEQVEIERTLRSLAIENQASQNTINKEVSDIKKENELLDEQAKSWEQIANFKTDKSKSVSKMSQLSDSENLDILNQMSEAQNSDDNIKNIQKLNSLIKEYSKMRKSIANGKDIYNVKDINAKKKQIELLMNSLSSGNDLSSYEAQLNKISNSIDAIVENKKSKFKSLIDELKDYNMTSENADEYKKIVNSSKKYSEINIDNDEAIKNLNEVISKLEEIKKQERQISTAKLSNLYEKLTKYKSKGYKLTKEESITLEELISKTKEYYDAGGTSAKNVEEIIKKFNMLKATVNDSGRSVKEFFKSLGDRVKDVNVKFFAQYFSFQDILRYGREAITVVTELDTAITELRKVSDASEERLSRSFEKSAETAKELGSTISDVINMTSDWARLGYTVDQSEELARTTTLFKTVGDNMDADSASEYLVSALQGFQLDADEAIDIVDKYNEVANNFAIDTAGIGEAIQRSAASFKVANTDLSQSIALVTATNAVVQDPDSVGTMWKTNII